MADTNFGKNAAVVALGWLGGLKGEKGWAKSPAAATRKRIAKRATNQPGWPDSRS